jgi:hypothetical protein
MPNLHRKGFRWVGHKNAPSQTNPPIILCPVADDFATTLKIGVPVKRLSTGYIEDADPGDTVFGVFVGAEQYYDSSIGALRGGPTLPASTSYDTNGSRVSLARVIPARDQLFEINVDDNTTATTYLGYVAFLHENAEWAVGTDGDEVDGAVLDISGHNTTNTLSVRIEDIPDRNMQDFSAADVRLVVSFNLIQDTASGNTTGT